MAVVLVNIGDYWSRKQAHTTAQSFYKAALERYCRNMNKTLPLRLDEETELNICRIVPELLYNQYSEACTGHRSRPPFNIQEATLAHNGTEQRHRYARGHAGRQQRRRPLHVRRAS